MGEPMTNGDDRAQLGKWRMHSLHVVAASYGLVEAQSSANDIRLGGLD